VIQMCNVQLRNSVQVYVQLQVLLDLISTINLSSIPDNMTNFN